MPFSIRYPMFFLVHPTNTKCVVSIYNSSLNFKLTNKKSGQVLHVSYIKVSDILMTMKLNELDQYSEIIICLLNKSAVKINKWREKFMLEVLLLYLIIPGRINFNK